MSEKPTVEQLREALRALERVRVSLDDGRPVHSYGSPGALLYDAITEIGELRARETDLKKREDEHAASRVALDRLFAGVDGGLPLEKAVREAIGDTMVERAIAVLLNDQSDRNYLVLSKDVNRGLARMILQIEPHEIVTDRNLLHMRMRAFIYGPGPDLVHRLSNGAALCGLVTGTPGAWPPGHRWVDGPLAGQPNALLCTRCLQLGG